MHGSFILQVHYDTSFNADTSDVTSYLDQMLTHVQSHFCQISLGTQVHIEVRFKSYLHSIFLKSKTCVKIHLQVIGGYTYHADQTWTADGDILGGSVKDIAAADNSGADVQVFMCKDSSFYGTVGIAWVGTMCKTYYSGYNANLNEKRQNVLASSSVNCQTILLTLSPDLNLSSHQIVEGNKMEKTLTLF